MYSTKRSLAGSGGDAVATERKDARRESILAACGSFTFYGRVLVERRNGTERGEKG
jgi:hypothetical protein